MEKIYKTKLVRVKESTQVTDGIKDTFYSIDVFDGEPIVLTSFEVVELKGLLNSIKIEGEV